MGGGWAQLAPGKVDGVAFPDVEDHGSWQVLEMPTHMTHACVCACSMWLCLALGRWDNEEAGPPAQSCRWWSQHLDPYGRPHSSDFLINRRCSVPRCSTPRVPCGFRTWERARRRCPPVRGPLGESWKEEARGHKAARREVASNQVGLCWLILPLRWGAGPGALGGGARPGSHPRAQ